MEHSFICNAETAVVETDRGRVRGYIYDGITIFKGIPYAKAKRFHAPEPADPWEGVFEATNYGYVCPLLDFTARPNGELAVPHRFWVMNEHCQNLNIWTPACDGKKRPVMVWLHGGGFEAGSAIEQIAYEGENMCRLGDVVVISINHRLNVLGYCDLSDFGEEYANSGNAGTDDIIAALRWIRNNVEAFGGDKDNVTVFGQSGGGAKVTALLQSPAADGLFAKGINMSGVIGMLMKDAEGSGKDLAEALMKELKVDSVKELETVPYESLAAAYLKVRPVLAEEGKYVGGVPQLNACYAGDPNVYGFRKESAHIPLMVGSVYGEFASFAPNRYNRAAMSVEEGLNAVKELLGEDATEELKPLFQAAYPERNPVDLLTLDFMFRLPEQEYIKKRSALNQNTYSYIFNLDLSIDGGKTPWHCADIPFFFHNTELVPVAWVEGVTERLEQEIFESVMAFARTGAPGHDGILGWPASTPDAEHTMVFGRETGLRTNFDAELIPALAKHMGPVFERLMKTAMENAQH